MTQFEYVSVAVALLYAIGIGQLLMKIPDAFESGRRYWVHGAWMIYLLLFSAGAWWGFFELSGEEFTPVSFLVSLCPPALVIVRVQLLCGRASRDVTSYRRLFYQNRIPFFAVGLASITTIQISPWLISVVPFGEITTFQLRTLPFTLIWICGICTANHIVHGTLVTLMLFLASLHFFVHLSVR